MESTSEADEIGDCPVCKMLPWDDLASGIHSSQLEFRLDDATIEGLQLMNPDIDKRLSAECDLYCLLKYLHNIWSGGPKLPLPKRRYDDYWMLKDRPDCCHKRAIVVSAEPNSTIGRIRKREDWTNVHQDPLGPPMVSRLRHWVKTCEDEHESCHREDIPRLPSRVIDIGTSSSLQMVRLLETSDDERAPYIALSHCWGLSTPFITTKDNINKMKKGISISDMPATFRDAITVSHALGIRYLWIDSLCIIQGDSEDWERESSRMGPIYRDSTLTVAASNAASDTEGFLKPRPLTHSTLKFISNKGQTAEMLLRIRQQDLDIYNHLVGDKRCPLDLRGWCLQETYLPHRLVKFLDYHVVWRCQQSRDDEPGFLKQTHSNPLLLREIFRNAAHSDTRPMRVLSPYQGWYRMVEEYTQRSLTYDSDKLPGVAGLAALVAENDGTEYCAGIWREDVLFGLCWRKRSTLTRLEGYVAPSWSWASVNGPIHFLSYYHTYANQNDFNALTQATFHGFYSAKRGLDRYGRIDMAWVHLEAPMTSISAADENKFQLCGLDSSDRSLLCFDVEEDSNEGAGGLKALWLMRRLNDGASEMMEHGNIRHPRVILYGLILRGTPHLSQRCVMFGLKTDAPIYQRIGIFQILTTQEREREFFDKNPTAVIIV